MNQLKKGAILLIIAILLNGCGTTGKNDSSGSGESDLTGVGLQKQEALDKKILKDAKVIVSNDTDRILVDNVFYKIDENTEIKTKSGEKLSRETLNIGDLITLKDTGKIAMSLPGQGVATAVTLFDEPRSKELSEGIRTILKQQEIGSTFGIKLKFIKPDSLSIEWQSMDDRKQYRGTVNLESKEVNIETEKN